MVGPVLLTFPVFVDEMAIASAIAGTRCRQRFVRAGDSVFVSSGW